MQPVCVCVCVYPLANSAVVGMIELIEDECLTKAVDK